MKFSESIKSVSYVKANASDIIRRLGKGECEPVIITQNGEAKAVLQSVEDFERMQESLAMLKIVAMSSEDIDSGRLEPLEDVVDGIKSGTTVR